MMTALLCLASTRRGRTATSPVRVSHDRTQQVIRDNRSRHELNSEQRQTLIELGRFRVVAGSDLETFRFGGKPARMTRDLRLLLAQGLIERKTVWAGRPREEGSVLRPNGRRQTRSQARRGSRAKRSMRASSNPRSCTTMPPSTGCFQRESGADHARRRSHSPGRSRL